MSSGKVRTGIRALGLPDDVFEQRRPLRGQITKQEVRAVSLYLLGLRRGSVVWDIGAGTGSISIEDGVTASDGSVFAIERDEESTGLLRRNVAGLGSGNVNIVHDEAPQVLGGLPDPDSVFIGGSGGRLIEITDAAVNRLKDTGRIVVNLAALERTQELFHRLSRFGLEVELTVVNASRGKSMPDDSLRLEALNPVSVVSGQLKRRELWTPSARGTASGVITAWASGRATLSC